ncbi:MotE family protein [Mesobacillus harenae]|uniref:MotE family protein n=1 Tax=Mesobacillus harenae TaxID=2213203 RepID=UPI00157FE317|nr:MotE family protein [Mesobacillus harenae]
MAKGVEKEDIKHSRFQWFLFAIAIPTLFAITIALIVLSVAGFNVFNSMKELGQRVPFLQGEPGGADLIDSQEQSIIDLEASIKNKEANIEQLESKLLNKDESIERLNLKVEQLEMQIDELTAIKEENKRAFKEIVQTYESMSPKKAAPILTEMSEKEALEILSTIKADTLSTILEKMTPEEAANYTELLTAESKKAADKEN